MEQDAESQFNVEDIKAKGNQAIKENKYEEAMFHYTHALKIDPKNYSLYSNRSFAFLKMSMFYHAMEDAKETIRLKPDWPKGYFRKGQVEFATYRFSDAINSYYLALNLQPDNKEILDMITRTNKHWQQETKTEQQVPWLGAGIGIVIGVIIVIADVVFTNKPTLNHPILMALLTIIIAMIGFGIAKTYRYFVKCQRNSMLDPPPYVTDEEKSEDQDVEKKPVERNRYTKTQARYRFKKGKFA